MVGIICEPCPDRAFTLQGTGNRFRLDAHSLKCARGYLDLFPSFDARPDFSCFVSVIDWKGVAVAGLQRQRRKIIESTDYIRYTGWQVVFHVFLLAGF